MNSSPPSWAGASLDLEVLEKLRYDLGDDIVQRFMQNYVCLLPERLDGLDEALGQRDLQRAVPILRDLRAAGSMLGALGVAYLADLLEQHLRHDQIDRAAGELPALRSEAAHAIRALSHVTWPGEGHSPSR